ncbi:hypothetical protein AX774_g6891 [Zancudomyces culisetae]|uniref:Bystin n=2 Tax=Zancudomyces culisetae TaxID=1213189 RepID=A0A1R1PFE9_ZANCU|nr:hypothetical protein AX774_g6891 [Zancudomyces culisetae]|eukprot:OMH79676.1 hypothetical protein AX774_g6891 [Zancudomyces culisetae]
MWQDILDITEPMNWTANAVFMATRIFISNMKPKQAQIFLNTIVLEHVREDIKQNKKLNYHLYMALKKALYKPAAFFKGILFPICEDQYYTTTLKECVIVGSVLAKVSIPVLHSAAALLQLSGSDNGDTDSTYNGAKAIFIRILLDKKYALPYKVIDSLVYYFISFQNINNSNKNFNGGVASDMKLPVLWHQSLLVFSQRYKRDLSPDQRNAILDLVKVHYHHLISEEVRRELTSVNTNFESNYASNNQIDVSMDTS